MGYVSYSKHSHTQILVGHDHICSGVTNIIFIDKGIINFKIYDIVSSEHIIIFSFILVEMFTYIPVYFFMYVPGMHNYIINLWVPLYLYLLYLFMWPHIIYIYLYNYIF